MSSVQFEPERLVGEREVAAYLGISTRTLQCWRSRGTGPAFYRVGGQCRYRLSDCAAWLAAQKVGA